MTQAKSPVTLSGEPGWDYDDEDVREFARVLARAALNRTTPESDKEGASREG